MRRREVVGHWFLDRWLETALIAGLVAVFWWISSTAYGFRRPPLPTPTPDLGEGKFSGESALGFLADQVGFGPRPAGSQANMRTGDYIIDRLRGFGWNIESQPFTYQGVSGRNIIARAGSGPPILVGAHYDTRKQADRDPDVTRRAEPMLGANDGASGSAVLLELARSLDKKRLKNEVWLAFFDAEDNGGLDGWQFSAGAQYMSDHLAVTPGSVIVVDMIGDADQQIYYERNSTPELRERIWSVAGDLGYLNYFIPRVKWPITDDHMPFLARGIPAVDIIDFDYPFWHTTQDTLDKVSASSLERVGRVLETLLENNKEETSNG